MRDNRAFGVSVVTGVKETICLLSGPEETFLAGLGDRARRDDRGPSGGAHRAPAARPWSNGPAFHALPCATFCGILCGMAATIEELMQSAVDARRVAQSAIALAVREARAANWSWDRISAALGGTPNGETLRRNFGDGRETAS